MLVKYREDMVEWMTVTIGVLFILSGVTATISSFVRKRARKKTQQSEELTFGDADTAQARARRQSLSIGCGLGSFAGVGSIILGVVLALMPGTFVHFLIYILAAFLILGAVQQFLALTVANREGSVGFGFWIMPTLLLIAGIVALGKPDAIASAPLFFIGWCMIIYGIVVCVNGIKAYLCHKSAVANAPQNGKPDFTNAEVVEYEELPKND